MVLVLELVGIGVLGACISVLLCIIAEGTPREVLRAIGFKENSTKPRINQCTDCQLRENGSMAITAKLTQNSDLAAKEVRAGCLKPCMDFRKDFKLKCDNSARNLYVNNKMTVVKRFGDGTENQFSNENFQGSTNSTNKLCKYCKSFKNPNDKINLQENTKIFSIPDKNHSRTKNKLDTTKTYEKSKKLYSDEGTKVRTKTRRFLLPKTLIIDSKAKNNIIGNHGVLDDDLIERIICRHCYLEALRIKNNKAEKRSIDL